MLSMKIPAVANVMARLELMHLDDLGEMLKRSWVSVRLDPTIRLLKTRPPGPYTARLRAMGDAAHPNTS